MMLEQKEEDNEDRETKQTRKDDLLDRVNSLNKEEQKHFWTDLEKVNIQPNEFQILSDYCFAKTSFQ